MSEDTRTNAELNLRLGSYLCKPNDGYELDRREAQSDLAELKRRADEGQAARQEIERYKVALEVATESASKLDKRLALADRRNPMMYRTPFSYAEEALAEADRIIAERGKA